MKKNYFLSLLLIASGSIASSQKLQKENLPVNLGLEEVCISKTEKVIMQKSPFSNNFYQSRTNHLEEGFEGAFPPIGWIISDEDGDGHNWRQYSADPFAGSYSAGSASWDSNDGTLNPDNWLITPRVEITATGDLTYYVAAQDPDWAQENYSVLISTTGNNPADFTTVLFTETLPANSSAWNQRTISVDSYVGDSVYIAFRHHNSADWFNLKIDDVLCNTCDKIWPEYDLVLTAANFAEVWGNADLECTIYPIKQALSNPLVFEAEVINAGSMDQTNLQMTSSVASGASTVFSNNTPYGTLTGLATDTIWLDSPFVADTIGTYDVSIFAQSDSNTTSTITKSFEVQESVYARDLGSVSGGWQAGNSCGSFEVSNLFDIYADQDASSISAYIHGISVAGAEIVGKIYVFDAGAGDFTMLASTSFETVATGDIDNWMTLSFLDPEPLVSGEFYRVAIEGFQSNTDTVYIGTSGTSADFTSHILDNNGCIGSNTPATTYYITSTPMIRLNMVPDTSSQGIFVDEVNAPVNFSVYPNPNKGEFNLAMQNTKSGTYMISVNNILGQQAYAERLTIPEGSTQKTMDLSELEKGVYFFSITDENSSEKSVRKIVLY